MKLFFGKKENNIITMFGKHLDKVEEGIELLDDVIKDYMKSNNYRELCEKIDSIENQADVLRRGIEKEMYKGGFLPNFRGDLLGIIESVDKVMNKTESVSDIFYYETPYIPEELKDEFIKLSEEVITTYKHLKTAIESIFDNIDDASEIIKEVEKSEHNADIHEKNIKEIVFKMNLALSQKLHIKQICENMGDIADRAENTSDRLNILLMKRNIK
jgi:predicted phosphate transport protein (TIGR00153 family)